MLAELSARIRAGREPTALLLHGLPGSGRRRLAEGYARLLLARPGGGGGPLVHPDFFAVEPEPDKAQISVAQIRQLVESIALTASGGRKVALIQPAEAMNSNAANALLKTLEEPAGVAVLVLVTDNPRRLPATITSRCQRLRVPVPDQEVALTWLRETAPGEDWGPWLALAAGAPLAALALRQGDGDPDATAEFLRTLPDDLAALLTRAAGPVAVARNWAKGPVELALRWLEAVVTEAILAASGVRRPPAVATPPALQKLDVRPNIPAWFAYLDRIRQSRRQLDRGLNAELQLADLLLFWVAPGSHRRPAAPR